MDGLYMENPSKREDLGGTPIFGNTHMWSIGCFWTWNPNHRRHSSAKAENAPRTEGVLSDDTPIYLYRKSPGLIIYNWYSWWWWLVMMVSDDDDDDDDDDHDDGDNDGDGDNDDDDDDG